MINKTIELTPRKSKSLSVAFLDILFFSISLKKYAIFLRIESSLFDLQESWQSESRDQHKEQIFTS